MSSAVVSTPAALGRPFVFEDADAEVCPSSAASSAANKKPAQQESAVARVFQSAINNQKSAILSRVTPASRLDLRPAPEMVSSGIPAIDALTGGLPRGCLTEVCGPASSGRTTVLLAALAAATRRGEFCVVVDASDTLDPQSAADAGVELERLLWVRCGDEALKKSPSLGCPISRAPFAREVGGGPSQAAFNFEHNGKENGPRENASRQSDHRMEQVLRATDLLLESGGFGLIVLDLGDLPPQSARRIPLTTWFRFRRAVENKPTILLAIEQQAIAGSCSSLLLQLGPTNQRKETMMRDHPESSREAAVWDSPARQCRVAGEKTPKSRRDGTVIGTNDTPNAPPIAHPPHAQLLTGLNITAELIHSRLDRKPARSIAFASKTAWAG